ncbi:hypothetical protein HID58_028340 [Brassica napus]|uniref:Uncharacterized protein n=1 Tax=Brassica napus TaxID=3708 RepID=A0ABQ8C9X5_BRANA|nr:hypothetical protein HID58_028340 [Brassica napus]
MANIYMNLVLITDGIRKLSLEDMGSLMCHGGSSQHSDSNDLTPAKHTTRMACTIKLKKGWSKRVANVCNISLSYKKKT